LNNKIYLNHLQNYPTASGAQVTQQSPAKAGGDLYALALILEHFNYSYRPVYYPPTITSLIFIKKSCRLQTARCNLYRDRLKNRIEENTYP
jgi:hypothetical protein